MSPIKIKIKKALQTPKNRINKHRKDKEQAVAEKAKISVNGSKLCKLLRTEPVKERAGWKMDQERSLKKTHSEERKEPYIREGSHTEY